MAIIDSDTRPSTLYRYRPLTDVEREMDAIKGGYLYCAAFHDLNDPMEGGFRSSLILRRSENYKLIKRAIIQNKYAFGLCSFSEVYNHEPMWAHYADQFKGICVAHSFRKLLGRLEENVSFVRMFYNEKEPIIHRSRKEPKLIAKSVLSCKNYRWVNEREWRMFAPGVGPAYYRDIKCVTRVYLGSRISDDNRKRVTQVLGALRIPTHAMEIDKYSMTFVAS